MSRSVLLGVVFAVLVSGDYLTAEARQPNVVLIMADDLGYEILGANGGQSYATPHLDSLAATGMRFEHCHVQPLCTPTRVQLMTGQYNIRNYTQFGRIDRDATTFAHLLKRAGYATGIAGKWQLGRGKNLPRQLGFDESCLWQHTRRPSRYANPGLEYNGEERDFDDGEYGPDLVNEFALDFMTRHKDEPFLLYYPMMFPHSPFEPTPDSKEWNTGQGIKKRDRDVRYFADMVAYMDKLVDQVVAKLDELGIRDNTLVIFLGDNGTDREVTSQFKGRPYPGGKGLGNARGTHVPLIANWPGRVPAGHVNADLIDSADFLPTLCEATGANVPESLPIDGRSFLPQLLGEKGEPREWRYSWYSRHGGATAKIEFAMTTQHKLHGDGKFYDLANDPFEKRALKVEELSGEMAEVATMLQGALGKYADARPEHLRKAVGRAQRGARP